MVRKLILDHDRLIGYILSFLSIERQEIPFQGNRANRSSNDGRRKYIALPTFFHSRFSF